mgnify:CR=1 FL=1
MPYSLLILFLLTALMTGGCQMTAGHLGQDLSVEEPADDKPATVVLSDKPASASVEKVPKNVPDPFLHSVVSAATTVPELVEQFLQQPPVLPYTGDLPLSEHPRVQYFLERYQGPQRRTLVSWLQRSGRYIPKIRLIFASEGVPLDLAYLAMIESGFNVRAYSWAHAAGPWQFIEGTGRIYGLENTWWHDDRLDLERSTRAAARHLKKLHQRFDGDWYLAIAAYNAGGGRVAQAIRASGSRDFWQLTKGTVLRRETIDYVPKLLAALHLIRDPQAYGFTDLELEDALDYETVMVDSVTDLEVIAELCGVEYQRIVDLNPALKRWSTPPGVGDYPVRVPVGTAERFNQGYATLSVDERVRYYRHQIAAGDTLLSLAKRYRIRVDDIIALNKIRNPRALQVGQNLILPLRQGYSRRPVESLADSYARSQRQRYTVKSGDSLWSISRRFGVTEKQLRVWNTLGWNDLLHPGQTLLVSATAARVAASKAGSRPTTKMVYQVAPGDTLWGIGRRFAVETDQIRDWNDLDPNHVLRPGQKLTLLVTADSQG